MLQDVLAQRKTEIEAINGSVSDLGIRGRDHPFGWPPAQILSRCSDYPDISFIVLKYVDFKKNNGIIQKI
jgi:hypothetical protein